MEKRLEEEIPILGRVYVNFIDLSSRFLEIYKKENEFERQKKTAHLGLISTAFKGINHSRFDYLILQCVISELTENNFKGTASAQGNVSINGKTYFGNDIIKCWFLLSNFGHCKNTIGDEKTLLLKCIQHKGFKKYLSNTIKDRELREWSEGVIEDFDYVAFHHILSIWRIYRCLRRRSVFRDELIDVYKLLLLDSSKTSAIANSLKVEQLKMTYGNIRDLSIISLDTRNSSLPVSIDILSTILSFDFYESRYQETKSSQIFNPLLSLLCDQLYLHPKAQTFQRSYEVTAINFTSINFGEVLEKGIQDGLSDPEACNLIHFLRTGLHENYIENVNFQIALRNVLTVKREVAEVEASMDFNPFSNIRVIDFYIKKETFRTHMLPKFLSNISSILEAQISGTLEKHLKRSSFAIKGVSKGIKKVGLNEVSAELIYDAVREQILIDSWDSVLQQNIPTFKDILWAVLRFHLREEFYFEIDHHISKSYNFFGVRLDQGIDLLNSHVVTAIDENVELDRKHELKQLHRSTKRRYQGVTIACLARITIFDYSKSPSHRKVTDIDSLVLKFNKNEMILELHESKRTRRPFADASRDLKNKVIKILNKRSKGMSIKEVRGYGAKIVVKHKSLGIP